MTKNNLEKVLNDTILSFVYNVTEKDIDEWNGVSISTFNHSIFNDIGDSALLREIWEKGLTRKLSSIFINLIKNKEAYIALHNDGYAFIHVDKKDNIVINILDYFENDYNFENTTKDNNTRQYTFYYSIIDNSAEYNSILINGRFDFDVAIMYISKDNYKDYISENESDILNDDVSCFEVSFEVNNKIYFNRYITEDYANENQNIVIAKETMLLRSIFNDLDTDKINDILDEYPN